MSARHVPSTALWLVALGLGTGTSVVGTAVIGAAMKLSELSCRMRRRGW